MTFLNPLFLWLLLPLVLLFWRSTSTLVVRVHLIILALLLLSLARPAQKEAWQEASIEAKDIIIALDVSYSMRATDLSPTRYDFAKKTIKALLAQNPSDNVMLIAFTTNPLLLSPPTTDHTLINVALESLNPKYILTKGTSLKHLFTKLSTLSLSHKNLILMTDGGEESDVKTLSRTLQESDLSLSILVLGSKRGTTIQDAEGKTLKDKHGNLVVSRINPLLEKLSASVEGSYLSASSTPEATAEALSDILQAQVRNTQQIQKMQRHYKALYAYPLALALLLFLLLHTRGVKYLLLVFGLLGMQAEASLLDDYHLHHAYTLYAQKAYTQALQELKEIETPTLQSQWAVANSYYKQGRYKKAIGIYRSIRSTSPKVKQQLYYNIATAYSKLQAYDKAKIYYTKTLQLGKEDDAMYNLARIALLHDKKEATLGIAHPKSQGANAAKSAQEEAKEKKTKDKEDQPSSGSGGGGEQSKQKSKESEKKVTLMQDKNQKKQPLGSKTYELINKGYIHETQPW